MASRKGSLLERNVELLLKLSGFNPILNKLYNDYEIDIFLKYKNKIIAFECKQYERSTLAVRNLIHQWDSKNKELKFDKIVLVVIGCDISESDYKLAKKYNITIWDENKLTHILNNAIDKKEDNHNMIIRSIGIPSDDDTTNVYKLQKTNQFYIFKDALENMLNEGVRDSGSFIIFDNVETTKFVQYAYQGNGFYLDIPKLDDIQYEQAKDILNYFNFSDNQDKSENYINDNLGNVINAECGDDVEKIAFMTDILFKELHRLGDVDYEISVTIHIEDS